MLEKVDSQADEYEHFSSGSGAIFQSRFIRIEFKPFGARKDEDDSENYYVEREWRILNLSACVVC